MSAHVQKPGGRGRRRRTAAAPVPDSEIADARHDVDVVSMATAEVQARTAGREVMIATAAYYRAEKRGFAPGHELEDWLAAEAEVTGAGMLGATAPAQDTGRQTPGSPS